MGAEVPGVIVPPLPCLVIPFQHHQDLLLAVPIAQLGCPGIITSQVLGPHDGSGIEPVDALKELGGCWLLAGRWSRTLQRLGGTILVEQDPTRALILDATPDDGGRGDHEVDLAVRIIDQPRRMPAWILEPFDYEDLTELVVPGIVLE